MIPAEITLQRKHKMYYYFHHSWLIPIFVSCGLQYYASEDLLLVSYFHL